MLRIIPRLTLCLTLLCAGVARADEVGSEPGLLLFEWTLVSVDGAEATAARMERAGMKGPELALVRGEAAVLRGRPEDALALVADVCHCRISPGASRPGTWGTANAVTVFRHLEFCRQCLWPDMDVQLMLRTAIR